MDPYNLFVCLGLRSCNIKELNIIYRLFVIVSEKLFKVPDVLYSKINENIKVENKADGSKGDIGKAIDIINRLDDIGSKNLQYFKNSFGMYQGAMNVTSSIYCSDTLKLINTISELKYKVICYGVVTSDDSNRFILTRSKSLYSLANNLLSVHLNIYSGTGIKRNLYKSSYSTRISEFNSIYKTPSGIFIPEIKSRLTYVDFSSEHDYYKSAIRIINQSKEYLHAGGSMIGSKFVFAFNTLCHLRKFRLIKDFLRVDKDILYNVPLEIGGITRLDVTFASEETLMHKVLPNYLFGSDNIKIAIAHYVQIRELETIVENDPETEEDYNIRSPLKIGKSGVFWIHNRKNKKQRKLREMIYKTDNNVVYNSIINRYSYPLVSSLIDCFRREESEELTSSSAVKYTHAIFSEDTECFLLNSFYQSLVGAKTLSLKGLRALRRTITSGKCEISETGDGFYLDVVKLGKYEDYMNVIMKSVDSVESEYEDIRNYVCTKFAGVDKPQLTPIPRFPIRLGIVKTSLDYLEADQMIIKFKKENLPRVRDGELYGIDYIEALDSFLNSLKKFTRSVIKPKLAISHSDKYKSIIPLFYVSNFCYGGRLQISDQSKNKVTKDKVEMYSCYIKSIKKDNSIICSSRLSSRSRYSEKFPLDITDFILYYKNNINNSKVQALYSELLVKLDKIPFLVNVHTLANMSTTSISSGVYRTDIMCIKEDEYSVITMSNGIPASRHKWNHAITIYNRTDKKINLPSHIKKNEDNIKIYDSDKFMLKAKFSRLNDLSCINIFDDKQQRYNHTIFLSRILCRDNFSDINFRLPKTISHPNRVYRQFRNDNYETMYNEINKLNVHTKVYFSKLDYDDEFDDFLQEDIPDLSYKDIKTDSKTAHLIDDALESYLETFISDSEEDSELESVSDLDSEYYYSEDEVHEEEIGEVNFSRYTVARSNSTKASIVTVEDELMIRYASGSRRLRIYMPKKIIQVMAKLLGFGEASVAESLSSVCNSINTDFTLLDLLFQAMIYFIRYEDMFEGSEHIPDFKTIDGKIDKEKLREITLDNYELLGSLVMESTTCYYILKMINKVKASV